MSCLSAQLTSVLYPICSEADPFAVEVVGRGRIAVLFVHGLGSNRNCWHRAAEYFDPERYQLILPDLPGFGESIAKSGSDYSMAALGKSLRTVVENLCRSEWHVVAHSMGGAAALSLLADSGRIANSFTCVEGNLVARDAFLSRKIARLSEGAFVKAYPRWVKSVESSLGEYQNDQHRRYVHSLLQVSPEAIYRAACSCLRASCSGELACGFAELTCPTAYVYGERTRRARGVPEVALLPQIRRLEVPGQGHFVMENADCFYRWLRQWVDGSLRSDR